MKLKKDPLKFKKIHKMYKEASNKRVKVNRPSKVDIMIKVAILKYSKTKN